MNSGANSRSTLVVVCFTLFSLGLVMASFGPVLGEFSANTQVSLAAVGTLFTALFLGALLTQFFSSFISRKIGLFPMLQAGTLVAALGMTGMTFSRSLPMLLGSALIMGFGHGATNFSANLGIATLFTEKRASAVNFSNIFYALGAFIGPALAGVAVNRLNTGLPVIWLGALLLVIASLMMLRMPQGKSQPSSAAPSTMGTARTLLASPLLWAVAVLSLFYGGSENGMSGWTATFMQQSVRFTLEQASFVTSGFYLALMLGRIACTWLGSKMSEVQILNTTLSVTFAGTVLFAAGSRNPVLSTLAVLIIGLGYGGTYPTMIAFATSAFKEQAAPVTSILISLNAIGGSALPALLGVLLEQSGPLAGASLVAAMALVMLLASLASRRILQRDAPGRGVAETG
jgi:fucose permease